MDYKLSVCVKALIKRNGLLLIVQRSDGDVDGGGVWEFPGGCIEFSESCEEALEREIQEETGMNLISEKLLYISSFFPNSTSKMFVLNYQVEVEGNVILSDEHQNFCWANSKQLKELLLPAIYSDYHHYQLKTQNYCP